MPKNPDRQQVVMDRIEEMFADLKAVHQDNDDQVRRLLSGTGLGQY